MSGIASNSPPDPFSIYSNAMHWRRAALSQFELPTNLAPAMACAAFSLELFLKCLLCLETGKLPRGHRLRELFAKLSPEARDKIQTHSEEALRERTLLGVNMDRFFIEKAWVDLPFQQVFENALDRSSDGFTQIRYHFEQPGQVNLWMANFIVEGTCRYVHECQPTWEADVRRESMSFRIP